MPILIPVGILIAGVGAYALYGADKAVSQNSTAISNTIEIVAVCAGVAILIYAVKKAS